MNELDHDYLYLLKDIKEGGVLKEGRNGSTLSVFGRTIRHNMRSGFPLLTTKKMHFTGVITELLWFLRGRTDLRYLLENNCNIWVGDAYKAYLNTEDIVKFGDIPHTKVSESEFISKILSDDDFSERYGDLGPIYGHQWRDFGGDVRTFGEDQLADAFNQLRNTPDSRRILISAWNPQQLHKMTLPPCHYSFQFYTKPLSYKERYRLWFENNYQQGMEYDHNDIIDFDDPKWLVKTPNRSISLLWNQRSVDTPLGLPYNIASYALLLEIVGKCFNMQPDELIGELGDCHIYTNQIDGINEQLTRTPFRLPKLNHLKTDAFYTALSEDLSLFTHLEKEDFYLVDYMSHPRIVMPLSN